MTELLRIAIMYQVAGDVKWMYIRELIHKKQADMLYVQEIKLASLNTAKCFNLWGSNDISWVYKGTNKEGGGILTM